MARLAPTDRSDKLGVASLVPTGITSLSPDDTRNRLTVKGTPEAIKQIENIARLLDVKPRLVRLQVRILRAPVMTNSAPEAELPESRVVVTAEGSVRNNVPLNLNAVGDGQLFRVFVTPHINGDQTISLSAEFSEVSSIPPISVAAPDGAQTAAIQVKNSRLWTRRIAGGTRTVLASVPNEADRTAAYYLEITPVVQPNGESQKTRFLYERKENDYAPLVFNRFAALYRGRVCPPYTLAGPRANVALP